MTDGGYTADELWHLQLQHKARDLCETEADMLLDFCGLEHGKVIGGAAMWACLGPFVSKGLLQRTVGEHGIGYEPTKTGRDVAAIIQTTRIQKAQVPE